MQAHEQLILDSAYAVVVLGRGDSFVLVDVVKPVGPEVQADATARGLYYCGVIGLMRDRVASCWEPDPESEAVVRRAFLPAARLMLDRLAPEPPQTAENAVAWLRDLHAIPDLRN